MPKANAAIELPAPVPVPGRDMPTKSKDERRLFARITRETPRDEKAEKAFVATRAHMIRTHPRLDQTERAPAFAELVERVGHDTVAAAENRKTAPVPGGVGYGIFYTTAFKSAFDGGTSFYFEIVCPSPPGGNVNTWLYLTGMNRASRGIEAFVSYYAQENFHFKVFDWARADHWQIDCPFANLSNYLGSVVAHGSSYQVLGVWNSTFQISSTQWRNEAWLWNRSANRWDLIYRYDYVGTQAEQTGGWIGSWAPIVETFQSPYFCTKPMGALNTMLISRNASGTWGSWQLLSAANSYVRTDNVGFHPVFLDPNYALVVHS
ncbi:MAG TPA: hypothetical protein VFV03_04055 [Solirubrobacteraceae bacterium]|nr:hypothetical protein [Solirubrobacteraceae bacterium]